MAIAPLLQEFVDDELKRSADVIEAARLSAFSNLQHASTGSVGSSVERTTLFDLIELLQARKQSYTDAFVQSLRRLLTADLDEQSNQVSSAQGDLSGTLTLLDESRVESDIEIARVVQGIKDVAEWELRELQTFTSTLSGHVHVIADTNPLGPLLYARALWEAVIATTAATGQRRALMRVCGEALATQLKKAWAGAATRLEDQGVKPGIYRTTVLTPGSGVERAGSHRNTVGVIKKSPKSAPGQGGVGSMVGHTQRGRGTGWPTVRSDQPARSHSLDRELEETLRSFEEVLRDLPVPNAHARRNSTASAPRLRDHQVNLSEGASQEGDRQVIDLLSRLFDIILSDVSVHPGLRILIARLQASALRVALHEASMMEDREHPAWALMDLMGKASALYTEAGDPRLDALLTYGERLVNELAPHRTPDGARYRRANEYLSQWLSAQLAQQLAEATPQVEQLSRTEQRHALQAQLSLRLRTQLGSLQVPETLRHFITDTWAKVLAESFQRYGEDAEATVGYVKAVDDLLWSLTPLDHPTSQRRLLSVLPGLLQRLRRGMALIQLPTAAQETVLSDLLVIHTEALRPGERELMSGLSTQSAEQIVQELRDEVLEDHGRSGFADSLIDVSSMDTVPAELIEVRSPNMLVDTPQKQTATALKLGARRRLFVCGRWMRVQLMWRSPQGSLLLFGGESPGRTHSITERALQRLIDEGLLLPLEEKSLVQRAIESLYRELG